MNAKGLTIKQKIDFNNKLIQNMLRPDVFTLNNAVAELLSENIKLQSECEHEYDEDGVCVYCYKIKED